MEKRPSTSTFAMEHKRTKREDDDGFGHVTFSFDEKPESETLLESIENAGNFKDPEFWSGSMVIDLGQNLYMRLAYNDESNQLAYFFMKKNDGLTEDGKQKKPSIVFMERRYFGQLKTWMDKFLAEVNCTATSQLIPMLAAKPELASPERINNGISFGLDFYNPEISIICDKFRVRPVFNKYRYTTELYFNNARENYKGMVWIGPLLRVSVGQASKMLKIMMKLESQMD